MFPLLTNASTGFFFFVLFFVNLFSHFS